jgi:ribose transport system substrate-binding protein
LTSEFHIAARDKLKSLCDAAGYSFVSVDGNNDNQRQINAIEDMITAGVNVLVLCPVSRDGILPALKACKEAGVMVIGYDSKATDTEYLATYIASDNTQDGRLTGEYLIKKFPKGGTLAIIDNQKAESVVSRVNGLKAALKGSKIQVVADDNISSLEDILKKVEDNLQKRPDLTFYWALNDDCALTAIGAIQTAGAKTVVIGVDGTPSGKKAIKQGIYLASAAQSPIAIAQKAFDAMNAKFAGKSVDKEFLIPTFIVDRANVDKYGVDSWQ